MALNKDDLAKWINEAFLLTKVKEGEPFPGPEIIAAALANAIDKFVRSGEVTGIVSEFNVRVTTTGAAGTQMGIVTGEAAQNKPVNIT